MDKSWEFNGMSKGEAAVLCGMKRALGQHKAPFGDIEFEKSTAIFDKMTNNLVIKNDF